MSQEFENEGESALKNIGGGHKNKKTDKINDIRRIQLPPPLPTINPKS